MTIEAYAKVNFTLEVLGRRTDGYHSLRSVVMPISLSDTVSVTLSDELTSDSGFADDLCIKAASALKRHAILQNIQLPSKGATIKTVKRIPVGGGLGGGSADAAATLILLNEMWGLHFSRETLAKIGAEVGSDVPALTLSCPVLMEGRGEKVAQIDGITKSYHLVLVNPGVFVSTPEVFKNCKSRMAQNEKILYNIVSSLREGDVLKVAEALMNDLEEPAIRLHHEINSAAEILKSEGVTHVTMSGSGSTVFGLVSSRDESERIAARLTERGLWAKAVYTIVR